MLRIAESSGCSPCCFLIALDYLDVLQAHYPIFALNQHNLHRFVARLRSVQPRPSPPYSRQYNVRNEGCPVATCWKKINATPLHARSDSSVLCDILFHLILLFHLLLLLTASTDLSLSRPTDPGSSSQQQWSHASFLTSDSIATLTGPTSAV